MHCHLHKKLNCTIIVCSNYRLICTINTWVDKPELILVWSKEHNQNTWVHRVFWKQQSYFKPLAYFNTWCTVCYISPRSSHFSTPGTTGLAFNIKDTVEILCPVEKCLIILVQICLVKRYWHLVDYWYWIFIVENSRVSLSCPCVGCVALCTTKQLLFTVTQLNYCE